MSMQKMIVVSDRFIDFTETENVISVSAAEKLIGDAHTPSNVRLHLGQGVSVGSIERLISIAQQSKKSWILNFTHVKKSGRAHVHKHNPRNSMLAIPLHIGPNLYSIDVFLDDECAEMSDHLSGQHIQGMVLVEAARQAFLTVTEEFYLKDNEDSSYFVINKITVDYQRFVFPVAIKIVYEVVEHQPGKNGSHRFRAVISVIQNEEVCCVMTVAFSTYFDQFIKTKEKTLAQEAVVKELFPEALNAQVI